MTELKEQLKNILLNNRPNLSDGTIKTYLSVLCTLINRLSNKQDINIMNDTENILKYVDIFKKDQSKKTILSALFVLTNNEVYKNEMQKYSKIVNDNYKEKLTNPERLKNKPTKAQLENIYSDYKKKLDVNPTVENYVNYFIVAVTSGVLMPPRRCLDYSELKIRNYNKLIDNCVLQKQFLFNQFKTAKYTKPEDRFIDIPLELKKYIKKWKKINSSDFFLIKKNGEKFSSSALTKSLNKIYGPHIGIDVLRSVYLQQSKNVIDALDALKETTKNMGTSVQSASNFYIKNDV